MLSPTFLEWLCYINRFPRVLPWVLGPDRHATTSRNTVRQLSDNSQHSCYFQFKNPCKLLTADHGSGTPTTLLTFSHTTYLYVQIFSGPSWQNTLITKSLNSTICFQRFLPIQLLVSFSYKFCTGTCTAMCSYQFGDFPQLFYTVRVHGLHCFKMACVWYTTSPILYTLVCNKSCTVHRVGCVSVLPRYFLVVLVTTNTSFRKY